MTSNISDKCFFSEDGYIYIIAFKGVITVMELKHRFDVCSQIDSYALVSSNAHYQSLIGYGVDFDFEKYVRDYDHSKLTPIVPIINQDWFFEVVDLIHESTRGDFISNLIKSPSASIDGMKHDLTDFILNLESKKSIGIKSDIDIVMLLSCFIYSESESDLIANEFLRLLKVYQH